MLDLPDRDSFVLSRLIHVLGVMLYAAGAASIVPAMGSALLEYLVSLRYHRDAHVRRAVLAALLLALRAIAATPDLAAAPLQELYAWLPTAATDDPDELCRKLAAHAVATLRPSLLTSLAMT